MDNKVVMVTGGGRGIGRALCRQFGKKGARVIALARSEDQLGETKQLVEADGGKLVALARDVTNVEALGDAITETSKRFGRLDVLVNNAGLASCAPAADLDVDDFERMLRLNIAAVFYACRFVWPIMKGQGGGTIVNISSMAADDPFPGLGTYGASKAWVNLFTKGLAAEGKEANITAFAVGPGAVETAMLRDAFPDFPANDTLAPEQVAEFIDALTQPAMASASGQTFYVKR